VNEVLQGVWVIGGHRRQRMLERAIGR
jgi:hypothetical protein